MEYGTIFVIDTMLNFNQNGKDAFKKSLSLLEQFIRKKIAISNKDYVSFFGVIKKVDEREI
jgi:hypothetical protein